MLYLASGVLLVGNKHKARISLWERLLFAYGKHALEFI